MNKKVYVVSYYAEFDCVFSTEELAKNFCNKHNKNQDLDVYTYEECIIDEENGL